MHSKASFFLAGLIWIATLTGGFAQPDEVLEFIKLRHEPHELARLEVTDILQDRFGFLWFATTKGLIRYDGHDLKTYRENPLAPYSIGSNFLRKLAEDKSGLSISNSIREDGSGIKMGGTFGIFSIPKTPLPLAE